MSLAPQLVRKSCRLQLNAFQGFLPFSAYLISINVSILQKVVVSWLNPILMVRFWGNGSKFLSSGMWIRSPRATHASIHRQESLVSFSSGATVIFLKIRSRQRMPISRSWFSGFVDSFVSTASKNSNDLWSNPLEVGISNCNFCVSSIFRTSSKDGQYGHVSAIL